MIELTAFIAIIVVTILYYQCKKKVVVMDGNVAATKVKLASECKSKISGIEAKLKICNNRIATEKLEVEMLRKRNEANEDLLRSSEEETSLLRSERIGMQKKCEENLLSMRNKIRDRISESLLAQRKNQERILLQALNEYEKIISETSKLNKEISLRKASNLKIRLLKSL